MRKTSSFLSFCLLVALPLIIPRTENLAPPEGPPASSSDLLIVEQPTPTDELDYVLPEDMTSQP